MCQISLVTLLMEPEPEPNGEFCMRKCTFKCLVRHQLTSENCGSYKLNLSQTVNKRRPIFPGQRNPYFIPSPFNFVLYHLLFCPQINLCLF